MFSVLPGRLPLAFALSIVPILSQAAPPPPSSFGATGTRIPAHIPLQFEANRGQTDRRIKFISHGRDYTLFLTPTEAVMALAHRAAQPLFPQKRAHHAALLPALARASVLRMRLIGADPAAQITGKALMPGRVNYYRGRSSEGWQTNVPTYAQVQYKGVYPGIDLVYYGNQSRLEYDFVVAPHAPSAAIRLGFAGARSLRVDKQGNLIVGLPDGQVRWHKPVVYQQVNGKRIGVAGRYALLGKGQVGFQVARYDRTRPLVIDPVLVYSSYLGGSSTDTGRGIGLDASGNLYVVGSTSSTDFPIRNGFQTTLHGDRDIYVAKFSSTGALIYSTYLGGSGSDGCTTSTTDPAGNVYLTGATNSPDFPLKQAYQSTYYGGEAAVVAKLDTNGSLVFSTYLSGTSPAPTSTASPSLWDQGMGITYDSHGNTYVTGETYDDGFPTTANALQKSQRYCFVSKLGPSGSLLYSTYLGGTGGGVADYGHGIAVDAEGNMYVTGAAGSHDFPTVNAFQPTFGGGTYDAFLSKISADGSHLIYSTYIGGSGDEADSVYPYLFHSGLAVDANGNAYVSGVTNSTDFPVKKAFQPKLAGGWDAWVAKFDPNGQPLFSTYLGGRGDEYIHDNTGRTTTGLALDGADNIYLTGTTTSLDFPTKDAFQPAFGGGNWDAYVTKLDTNGALLYSTYLGGSGNDSPGSGAIAVDAAGNAYVAGSTNSVDFPIVNGFQPVYGGGTWDAFIVKISSTAFIASDFNGDGKPDIVFQNPGTGQLAVWYLSGATAIGGAFITPGQSPDWKAVGVADFNADSHPDLLFENPKTGQLALWLMDGATATGGLLLSSTLSAGWNVASIDDFNGDGHPDLLLQNQSTGGLSVWLMSGTAVSNVANISNTLPSGWGVVGSGDFNGDGKPDLVLQNSSTGRLAVWFMNGTTVTDGAYITPMQAANWKCVAVLDLNGDGKPDLLFQNSATGQLAYWIMNGTKAVDGNFFSTTPPSGWLVAGTH